MFDNGAFTTFADSDGDGRAHERLIAFPLPCLGSLGGPILIIFAGAFPPCLINAYRGARFVGRPLVEAAQMLGTGNLRIIVEVLLPARAHGLAPLLNSHATNGVRVFPACHRALHRLAPAASPRIQDHFEVRRADAAAPAVGVGAFARLRLDRPSPGQGSPPARLPRKREGRGGRHHRPFWGLLSDGGSASASLLALMPRRRIEALRQELTQQRSYS
jgi:hypothetical protein